MSSYFNTKHNLIAEIEEALDAVEFGSVEIYVVSKKVTQITVRNIKKTSIDITEPQGIPQERRQPKTFTIKARLQRSREQ